MKSWKKLGALEQRVALLCAVLFVAFILLFSRLPERIAAMEQQRKQAGEVYEFTDLFLEIYSEIRDRYVEEVDGRQLFEGQSAACSRRLTTTASGCRRIR